MNAWPGEGGRTSEEEQAGGGRWLASCGANFLVEMSVCQRRLELQLPSAVAQQWEIGRVVGGWWRRGI